MTCGQVGIFVLSALPRRFLSRVFGWLMSLKLKGRLLFWAKQVFIKTCRIDMKEASKPLADYESLLAVFTRHLKVGCRPVEAEVVFPCDGYLSQASTLYQGLLIQAKGLFYSPFEFLAMDSSYIQSLKLDYHATIYLSPRDYHRVHAPISGTLESIVAVPGDLWPVADFSVKNVKNLFAKNERVIFEIKSNTQGTCYVVMVGAYNVGQISSKFEPRLLTNQGTLGVRDEPLRFCYDQPKPVLAGDELGCFQLGSTVVLIFDSDFMAHWSNFRIQAHKNVKMGQKLIASEN